MWLLIRLIVGIGCHNGEWFGDNINVVDEFVLSSNGFGGKNGSSDIFGMGLTSNWKYVGNFGWFFFNNDDYVANSG